MFLAILLLTPGAISAQANGQGQSSTSDKSGSQSQSDNPTTKEKGDKSNKSNEPPSVKLKIEVTGDTGKPVANASIYVRFNEPGGLFHHDKLAEMNFKTNEDGTVKVPEVPQGKILIQVVAKGWHTYGKWYDIEQDGQTIQIKLEQPPHWY